MRPILKWAGGKARLAPLICEAFDGSCTGTYYEPFTGSAAVFLYRHERGQLGGGAVLSDVNPKLVAVHRAVRDSVDDVLAELHALPKDDWKERYYDVREAYNAGPWESPDHAARFVWLNRAGFNGLYRENRSGRFNVPVGRYDSLRLPPDDHFRRVAAALDGVDLRVADFRDILAEAGAADQVYCDPPYVPLTETARFTGYCASPFGLAEQRDLAVGARKAAQRGARVVLSNHYTKRVREELYAKRKGFVHVHTPRVARAISRKAASRAGVAEVIAAISPRSIARAG